MGCPIYIEKELFTVTCKLPVCIRVSFFYSFLSLPTLPSLMFLLIRIIYLGRNSKPANVLLQGDVPSGSYKAQLADFGVAAMTQNRDEDEDLTSETGTYR